MGKKSRNALGKEYYEMLIAKKQYEEMSKPFYKKIEYWKLVVTSILTFLTVFVMYKNGLFDFRTKELQLMTTSLELKKENLEYDVKRFTTEKDSLTESHIRLVEDNKLLQFRNIQIDVANRKAYSTLDQNGKLFVQIMLKNVELERLNQKLTDERNSHKSSWLNYSPQENVINNSSLSIDRTKNNISWSGIYENPFKIDLSNIPVTNDYFNNLSNSNSSNILDLSKYLNLGPYTKINTNLTSDYKNNIVIPSEGGFYISPVTISENSSLKSLNLSELLLNKKN